jgi:hypothetical protein
MTGMTKMDVIRRGPELSPDEFSAKNCGQKNLGQKIPARLKKSIINHP